MSRVRTRLLSVTALLVCGCDFGPLRVGTTGDYRPFSIVSDTGEFVGTDIELARAYAKDQGREVIFVKTSWPTLMADLDSGAFDIALSGITVTAERAASARFSEPYARGTKVAMVRCNEQERFKTLEDFANASLLVNPGGTNERFARRMFPKATFVVEPNNRRIPYRLRGGDSEAFFTDSMEAKVYTEEMPELCIALADAKLEPFAIAAMTRTQRQADKLSAWLASTSGTMPRE